MDELLNRSFPQWKLDRVCNYPRIEDLADALVHNANGDPSYLAAYFAACNAVKTQYPKS